VTALLFAKARLHDFVRRAVSTNELNDALILAAATLVILPLVPDRQIGPYGALNLHAIWIVIVLVMSISAAGYVAVRLLGARFGLPLSGLMSGFISSTATIGAMGARAVKSPEALSAAVAGAVLSTVSTILLTAVVVGATSLAALQSLTMPLVFALGAAMAYGLRNRRMPEPEIDTRVQEAARILELTAMLDRKPRQLSGGQRQRVAMGRAIVRQPLLFLFDEPLSNLDAKLRVQMRAEIRRLQQRLGVTSLFVTHDQVEAMTLGDRLVVMHEGRAAQIAPPMEVWGSPADTYVAGFIGSPAMNFLAAVVEAGGARLAAGPLALGGAPGGLINLPALIIALLVTGLLVLGVSESASVNNVIVLIKVGVLLLFIAMGERGQRLRVNGRAELVRDDPAMAAMPEG
jgi:ABC-type Fe3+/spermidine/putrescine transport system ATPase subunit